MISRLNSHSLPLDLLDVSTAVQNLEKYRNVKHAWKSIWTNEDPNFKCQQHRPISGAKIHETPTTPKSGRIKTWKHFKSLQGHLKSQTSDNFWVYLLSNFLEILWNIFFAIIFAIIFGKNIGFLMKKQGFKFWAKPSDPMTCSERKPWPAAGLCSWPSVGPRSFGVFQPGFTIEKTYQKLEFHGFILENVGNRFSFYG